MELLALLEKHQIKTPQCFSDLPKGWVSLVDELVTDLIKLGWNKDLHQVKEKFAGLRFYIGAATVEIMGRIDEAEIQSVKTCEECSAPGSLRGGGWLRTLCDACEELRCKDV